MKIQINITYNTCNIITLRIFFGCISLYCEHHKLLKQNLHIVKNMKENKKI